MNNIIVRSQKASSLKGINQKQDVRMGNRREGGGGLGVISPIDLTDKDVIYVYQHCSTIKKRNLK